MIDRLQRSSRVVLLCLLTLTFFAHAVSADTSLSERYRQALALDPENAALHYHFGLTLLDAGDNAGAVSEFTRAYPAYIDSLELNYNLGLAYARLNDIDNARIYLELAESQGALAQQNLYPVDNIWFNLALTQLERAEYDKAEELLDKVIKLSPHNATAHRLLGDCLARRGNTASAVKEFRTCLDIDPGDEVAREYLFALHYNQALGLIENPKTQDAARAELKTAITIRPDNGMAYYYLGYLDYQTRHYPETISNLISIANRVAPDLRDSLKAMLYNSGLVLLEQNRAKEAKPVADYVAAQPDAVVRELFLAGNIMLKLNDYAAADTLYQRVLKLDPAHNGALINLTIAQKGLTDERFVKARSLYQAGKFSEALPLFEQILQIKADYPLAREYARECRTELERAAIAFFDRAEQTFADGNVLEAVKLMRQGLAAAPQSQRGLALETTLLKKIRDDIKTGLRAADDLFDKGQLNVAKEAYQKILVLEPANSRAQKGLARVEAQRLERLNTLESRFHDALNADRLTEAKQFAGDMAALSPEAPQTVGILGKLEDYILRTSEKEARLGRLAYAENRADEGRMHFDKALALRDTPALRQELETLERKHTDKLNGLLSDVHKALAKNDFKTARAALGQAEAIAPLNPSVGKARTDFSAAVSQAVAKRLTAARGKIEDKNWRGALNDYRHALDFDPTNSEARQGLQVGKEQLQSELSKLTSSGATLLQGGDVKKAEEAFRRALEIDPYNSQARDGLDKIALSKQKSSRPGDENALYLRGIDLYTRGCYEEAITVWEKVLVLSPRNDKARLNIDRAKQKLTQGRSHGG